MPSASSLLSRVRLTFATAAVYHLRIEVSDDQKDWRLLADLRSNEKASATVDAVAPANTSGRFVRVRFESAQPASPHPAC